MSDPQPDRLKKRPPRAEPLQPDLPGRGDAKDEPSSEEQSPKGGDPSAKKQLKQSEAALENVRKGYD